MSGLKGLVDSGASCGTANPLVKLANQHTSKFSQESKIYRENEVKNHGAKIFVPKSFNMGQLMQDIALIDQSMPSSASSWTKEFTGTTKSIKNGWMEEFLNKGHHQGLVQDHYVQSLVPMVSRFNHLPPIEQYSSKPLLNDQLPDLDLEEAFEEASRSHQDVDEDLKLARSKVEPTSHKTDWLSGLELGEEDLFLNAFQKYEFNKDNPALTDNSKHDYLEQGKKKLEEGDLPSAVLLFEAAVQQDEENLDAWTLLGTSQVIIYFNP